MKHHYTDIDEHIDDLENFNGRWRNLYVFTDCHRYGRHTYKTAEEALANAGALVSGGVYVSCAELKDWGFPRPDGMSWSDFLFVTPMPVLE